MCRITKCVQACSIKRAIEQSRPDLRMSKTAIETNMTSRYFSNAPDTRVSLRSSSWNRRERDTDYTTL